MHITKSTAPTLEPRYKWGFYTLPNALQPVGEPIVLELKPSQLEKCDHRNGQPFSVTVRDVVTKDVSYVFAQVVLVQRGDELPITEAELKAHISALEKHIDAQDQVLHATVSRYENERGNLIRERSELSNQKHKLSNKLCALRATFESIGNSLNRGNWFFRRSSRPAALLAREGFSCVTKTLEESSPCDTEKTEGRMLGAGMQGAGMQGAGIGLSAREAAASCDEACILSAVGRR